MGAMAVIDCDALAKANDGDAADVSETESQHSECETKALAAVEGDLFKPMCAEDGSYAAAQCDLMNMCWCVTEDGQKIAESERPLLRGGSAEPCESVRAKFVAASAG